MANFFLIEHSLRDAAGHHGDYVQCVARAANDMGFLTTIGAHRSLPKHVSAEETGLDRLGNTRRIFRQTIYQPESFLAGLQKNNRRHRIGFIRPTASSLLPRIARQVRHYHLRRCREKYVKQFAADCERFFRNTLFTPNDHAFFTTVSELELMGLAVFLSRQPRTMQVQWHLQFHFNLFDGRPPEYHSQTATANAVRACFLAALSRISYHSVNFYTTSEELADQYNLLGVGEFEPLPYPVGTEYAPIRQREVSFAATEQVLDDHREPSLREFMSEAPQHFSRPHDPCHRDFQIGDSSVHPDDLDRPFSNHRPIRIACPGGVRREKGLAAYLQPLVDEIWEPFLSGGQAQLVLQRPNRRALLKQKIDLQVPQEPNPELPFSPIEYLPHPLSRQQYVDLIKSTDVGLLFYNSRTYYSRRAGVLNELLASGKPVIVPAGCWLAEQIQEPIFQHADQLLDSNEIRQIEVSDFRWESSNVPMPGGVLAFDQGSHPFNFEIDVDGKMETTVGLCFDWHWPGHQGVYCRVELTQFDAHEQRITADCQVVGHRPSKKAVVLFTIDRDATSLRFSLKNAFHASTASIRNVEVKLADADGRESRGETIPRGRVGVIAADQTYLARCVREVVTHLDHYQQTAQEFSHQWYAQHDPKRTVAHLIATEFPVSRVA